MNISKPTAATKRAFNSLPKHIQERFAKALQDIIEGRTPLIKSKMLKNLDKSVKGVKELIINGSPAYRVVYVVKNGGTLHLLHAFTKTTNGVDKPAMEVVVKRYKEIKT